MPTSCFSWLPRYFALLGRFPGVHLSILIVILFQAGCAGVANQEGMSKNRQPSSRSAAMTTPPATGAPLNLHEAIIRKDSQAVEAFLAKGADPNAADKQGKMPLQLAMASRSPEMVQRLISAGADVKASKGPVLLLLLAETNRGLTDPELEIAKVLIRSGADVNAKGSYQRTPLHHAATHNHAELARILIENGADVSAKDSFSSETPLHAASIGIPIFSAQAGLTRGSALETVEALLKGGANPNARDKYGSTPLHRAAEFLHIFVVDRLISSGADIHARDNTGQTPLHSAARGWSYHDQGNIHERCDEQIFRLLVVRGADKDIADNNGKIPSALINLKCRDHSMPPGVRAMNEKLKTMNKLALLPNLVLGLSSNDVISIVGPNHGFENKDCVIGNAVAHAAIYKFWEDGVFHKLYFKIPKPQDMVLDIAGFQKSTQVRVPQSAVIEGGSLIQYERNGELVTLPKFAIDPKNCNVRFFESGSDLTPFQERRYSRRFSRAETRFINWELQMTHFDTSRRKDFVTQVVYYRPDGSVLTRQHRPCYADMGWKQSVHAFGSGWKEPGRWQGGTYRVEMHVAGNKIIDGVFEVY